MKPPAKILIIQTAFIGDAILATSLVEALVDQYPNARIDFLLRKGNEGLLQGHPFLNDILVWDKKKNKRQNLVKLLGNVRKEKYDLVLNLQRYFSTGLLTAFSGAKNTIGFTSNPLSFFFSFRQEHDFRPGLHEVQRNLSLLNPLFSEKPVVDYLPRLYPSPDDYERVREWKTSAYVCLAPTSVWFTKQYPLEHWIRFIGLLPAGLNVFLLGGPGDVEICETIRHSANRANLSNLAGQLSFLQSAALLKDARMNFVNDSGPLHLCSAMNAPVTAIFCSTVPEFGFGPLSTQARVVQYPHPLACKPCGIHGFRKCPEGHFRCGNGLLPEWILPADLSS